MSHSPVAASLPSALASRTRTTPPALAVATPLAEHSRSIESYAWHQGPASLISKNGLVVAVNKAALAVFRRSVGDILEKPVAAIISEEGSISPSGGVGRTERTGSTSTSTPITTRPCASARPVSVISDETGSEFQVHWLRESRSPSHIIRRSSSIGSPAAMSRLAAIERHLLGNAISEVALAAGEELQDSVVQQTRAYARLTKEIDLLKALESETVVAVIRQDSARTLLAKTLSEPEITPFLSRIEIDRDSLALLDRELGLDWFQLEFVVLRLIENACKHSEGPVRITLSFDIKEDLFSIVIKDEGAGILLGKDYLRRAIDGETSVEGTHKDVKPGSIFRIAKLVCESVMQGHFDAQTSTSGTCFKLQLPCSPFDVTMDDLTGSLVEGAGGMPTPPAIIGTPPREPLRLPHSLIGGGAAGLAHPSAELRGSVPSASMAVALLPERRDSNPSILGRLRQALGVRASIESTSSSLKYSADRASEVLPSVPLRGAAAPMRPSSSMGPIRVLGGLSSAAGRAALPAPPVPDSPGVEGMAAKEAQVKSSTASMVVSPVAGDRETLSSARPSSAALPPIRVYKPISPTGASRTLKHVSDLFEGAGGGIEDAVTFYPLGHRGVVGYSPAKITGESGPLSFVKHAKVKSLEPVFVRLADALGIPVALPPAAGGCGGSDPTVGASRAREGGLDSAPLAAAPLPIKLPSLATAAAVTGGKMSSVSLPVKEIAKAAAVEGIVKVPLDAPVLVVDDEDSGRSLMTRMASRAGLKDVRSAKNGAEAITLVMQAIGAGKPFRVIFMDQMMPGFNGEQTAKAILALDPRAIVVAATGNVAPDELAKYRAAGMDELFVSKPATISAVKAVVAKHFAIPTAPAPIRDSAGGSAVEDSRKTAGGAGSAHDG